jgi:hypothetical protein
MEKTHKPLNQLIENIKVLNLNPVDSKLWDEALASLEKEKDPETRVRFLRLALRENTIGSVLADGSADELSTGTQGTDLSTAHTRTHA